MKRVLVLLAVVVLPNLAMAQEHWQNKGPAFWIATIIQSEQNMKNELPHIREQALVNAMVFARMYGDKIDTDLLSDHVINLLKRETEPQVRIAAIGALHAISQQRAIAYMKRLPESEVLQGKQRYVSVLTEYLNGRSRLLYGQM